MKNTQAKRIRVMLVDDHTMVRRGLATFLKVHNDLELAGEAGSGEEAIRACAEVQPDVILMDLLLEPTMVRGRIEGRSEETQVKPSPSPTTMPEPFLNAYNLSSLARPITKA